MKCPKCEGRVAHEIFVDGKLGVACVANKCDWHAEFHLLSPAGLEMVERVLMNWYIKAKFILELNDRDKAQQEALQQRFDKDMEEIANSDPVLAKLLAAIAKKIEENKP